MPTSIPYDPSLVLGSIVSQESISNILAIAQAQAPIDAAEDDLNSFISTKRSLSMTINEIMNMGIDPTEVIASMGDVDKALAQAAANYAKTTVAQQKVIQPLRAKIAMVHENYESPIDYNQSAIKPLPLAADSIKMDVQYFHFEREDQSASQTVANIQSFVSASMGVLGTQRSMDMSVAATSQVNQQREYHDIEGTLVFSVVCTHKVASVFAPFVIDVDKAIRVWNRLGMQEKIKTDDVGDMAQIAAKQGTGQEETMNLISGASFGSSFLGMVHILNSSATTSSQSMKSAAATLQMQFEMGKGAFFEDLKGGFGVASQFADNVQKMLSTQNVQAHVTVLAMGVIPSIKSNELSLSVQKFANFDGATMMSQLTSLANTTSSNGDTLASSAEAARTGQKMVTLKNAQISGVMAALAQTDATKDQVIDIASMMTALDDYVQKASGASSGSSDAFGVPINYYIKPITAAELAEMWMTKYYPGQYLAISGDDSKPAGAPALPTSQPSQ